jgi:peptidoglycan/LPS O-acetylase OafA/YrhL
MWTIYCEGFYYLIYPLLHLLFKKIGTTKVTLIFSLISIVLLFLWSDDRNMMFHELGDYNFLDWKSALLAFPCWLSGCIIANIIVSKKTLPQVSKKSLLKWRIGALFLSTLTFPLYRLGLYLGLVKLPLVGLIFASQFNLLMFGLYSFFWIKKEVFYYNSENLKVQPNKIFELMGKWSFSLYIIHTLIIWSFEKFTNVYFLGYLMTWVLLFISVHLSTYIFYTAFEKPSHKLSRYIVNKLKTR